jgi:hypothetical protein
MFVLTRAMPANNENTLKKASCDEKQAKMAGAVLVGTLTEGSRTATATKWNTAM